MVGTTLKVGEHNEDVLTGILDYSRSEVQAMYEANVIGTFHHYEEVPG